MSGIVPAVEHCCLVAAGLTSVHSFSPFSSRDAHIMLQLKRAFEAASSVSSSIPIAPCRRRLSVLFRSALNAGKAARNVDIVPEISSLRSFPSVTAIRTAGESALTRAISPCVVRCAEELLALDRADEISSFRSKAEAEAEKAVEMHKNFQPRSQIWRYAVRRSLHHPTTEMRAGRDVDREEAYRRAVAVALIAVEDSTE